MSIKLNKATQEKETIKQLIRQSVLNPGYELECVVGGNYNLGSIITHQQFRKIISRINGKKEYLTKAPEDKLIISFPRDTKFASTRVIIHGFGSINYYCINEKLDGILQNVTFQDKQYAPEKSNKHVVAAYNLKFNQKVERALEPDSALVRDMLRDWAEIPKIFRYKKIYEHIAMPAQDFSIDCSIVRSSGFEDRDLTVKEVMSRDLFNKVIKPADEKAPFGEWWKRIVKTPDAVVKVRNVNVYYKTIKESKVFENDFIYEVEIEYLADHMVGRKGVRDVTASGGSTKSTTATGKDKLALVQTLRQQYVDAKDKDGFIDAIFSGFFRHIGIVLQCVQDSFYLMNNTEVLDVLNGYTRLTGVKKGMENLFFGPLPVDLDNNKLVQYPETVYEDMNRVYENGNIVLDYCVTDKSDGTRSLLYIDGEGTCYMITRDGVATVKNTGVKSPGYANSVFDGEYIEFDKDGGFLNKYYVFDAYFVKGANIMKQPFGRGKEAGGRLWEIIRFVDTVITGHNVQATNDKYQFRIDKKTFLFGESSRTPAHLRTPASYNLIFTHCASLLAKMNRAYGGDLVEGHLFSYKTDGLVFTPVELGVYQSNLENDVPQSVLVSSRKWSLLYKWKNSEMLSIDFKVDFPTSQTVGPNGKLVGNKERTTMFVGSNKYALAVLLARNYDSHAWLAKERVGEAAQYGTPRSDRIESQLSSLLLNDNLALYNMPEEIPFMAAHPYMGTRDLEGNIRSLTHECLLPITGQDVKCTNGDIIYQDSVVEFIYDKSREPHAMRWIPVRVRYGKTPNAINTCLDIWNLIHNPVTRSAIRGGLDPTTIQQLTDINYYLHGRHLLTYGLKRFHNYAKGWLLERYMKNMTTPRVLDLGCGKMGDFFKYVQQGTGALVGIDINPDNLNNKLDGAASRVLNAMSSSPRVKGLSGKTLLVLGDISRNIADGSCATDDLGRYYLDVLYGRQKPAPTFNGKHAKLYNMGAEGFHVVVSMYVLHYCMGSLAALEGYLENVSQNLRDQGYFIGTCLDGISIIDELNRASTPRLEGKVNGHTVWSIDRSNLDDEEQQSGMIYDDSGALVSELGIRAMEYDTSMPHMLGPGNKVNMYFETMNMVSRENLVDIKYLEHKAKEYGLKLIESRRFTEAPGSLLDMWAGTVQGTATDGGADESKKGSSRTRTTSGGAEQQEPDIPQIIGEIKKESALSKWAGWQRYFVFQKMPQ